MIMDHGTSVASQKFHTVLLESSTHLQQAFRLGVTVVSGLELHSVRLNRAAVVAGGFPCDVARD